MDRVCSCCKESKTIKEFGKNSRQKDGLNLYCKLCSSEAHRKYANKNKQKLARYNAEYMKKALEQDPDYYKNRHKKHFEYNSQYTKQYNRSIRGRIKSLLSLASIRAKKHGWEYELDEYWLLGKFTEQQHTCSLTGIKFEFEGLVEFKGKNPYSPSLDRIDCSKGYTKDNVRLICCCVNYALNVFGTEVLENWCKKYLESRQNIC